MEEGNHGEQEDLIVDNEVQSEEDEDPVVAQIPVYMAKGLDCYLLQYPVRPASMHYENAVVKKVKFRPKNQQIEMHLAMNTDNDNYDTSRGEQIALNVDGEQSRAAAAAPNRTFTSALMDTQVLSGGRAVADTSRYAVGIINNGELHLTQVKGVLTVRPNLNYLDKSDKRAKAEGRTADPDDPTPEQDEKPEAVTVKFSKGENDRSAKWKEKSYQHMIKKEEEEPWINLQFSQVKSTRWEDESQNLFCNAMEHQIPADQSPDQYLQALKQKPVPRENK